MTDDDQDVFAVAIPDVPAREQIDIKELSKEFSDACAALVKRIEEITATKFKPSLKTKNDTTEMMRILTATGSLKPMILRLNDVTKAIQDAVSPTVAKSHTCLGIDEKVVCLDIENRPDPGINVADLKGLVSGPQHAALMNVAYDGWVTPENITRVISSGDAARLISSIKVKRLLIGRKASQQQPASVEADDDDDGPPMGD